MGSGPGRLTIALAERGIPALGIDVAPAAVRLTRTSGALALPRDVFGRVPGTGRWMTVLLADGSIGIGGDPVVLLRRIAELLAPAGQALVEIQPPVVQVFDHGVPLEPLVIEQVAVPDHLAVAAGLAPVAVDDLQPA